MKHSGRILTANELIKLMQTWLWCNDSYKVFFSTRQTGNPDEYYFFMLDIKSGRRKHGKYWPAGKDVIVEFIHSTYTVKELMCMTIYDMAMIQTTNTENEMDYMNWLGVPIPDEKGLPYLIKW